MKQRSRRYRGHTPSLRDYKVLAEFRYLLRQFASFSETAARAAGLTSQQHQALLAIRGFSIDERITVGELAERLNLRSHSAVGLINRLAHRGLVRRLPDPHDARRVRIEVSSQGGKVLSRLSQVHRSELQRLAPLLKRLLAQLA